MSIDPSAEPASFQQFVAERVSRGSNLSPEEALDLWRAENASSDEQTGTVAALREALADMDGGDLGVPLDEFDREFRRHHGLPSLP